VKENTNLIHLLNQTVRLLNKRTNETLQEFGLFHSQWTILYCLQKKGSMTQTEICKYLNVEPPTVTRTIRKLEENGWVFRTKGQDKRENMIGLSGYAQHNMEAIREKIHAFETLQLQSVDDSEAAVLEIILKKIMKEA